MDDSTTDSLNFSRLPQLAEFRYQLRRFLNFSEAESEKYGIAPQQYQLMQVIGALPEGQSASISYLADRMVLRHNSTVELVDRAERAKLVRRVTDERDLRRSLVVLTPEGRGILEKLIPAHLEELDGGARERLLRSLAALQETAGAEAGEPGTRERSPG